MSGLIWTMNSRRIKIPLYEITDKESSVFETIKTARCTAENYIALPLGLVDFEANKTYTALARFRTRGDADCSPERCSSVSFVARRPDDGSIVYSYNPGSAKAYATRCRVQGFEYSFRPAVSERLEAFVSFSVDGTEGGADGQTIDLYGFGLYYGWYTHVYSNFPDKRANSRYLRIRTGDREFIAVGGASTSPCLSVYDHGKRSPFPAIINLPGTLV